MEDNEIYNCSECQSSIEIINLDEEFFEFKCNNDHDIKINIKEYLNKLKGHKKLMQQNNNICKNHNEKYLSYCFECNEHLCEKCLISGEHSFHYKINIIEIKPKKEILLK